MDTLLEREVARQQLGEFGLDPNLALYLPLWKRDGDSIMSDDARGHLCTVTGAVWTPQGRLHDGIDDNVSCGASSVFNFTDGAGTDSPFTILVSAKATTLLADPNVLISKYDVSTAKRAWMFGLDSTSKLFLRLSKKASDDFIIKTADVASSSGEWLHLGVTYSGSKAHTGITLYVNGASIAATGGSGGTYTGLEITDRVVYIGRRYDAGGYFKGVVGEVIAYNCFLTPSEIQNNYLATKWRYGA